MFVNLFLNGIICKHNVLANLHFIFCYSLWYLCIEGGAEKFFVQFTLSNIFNSFKNFSAPLFLFWTLHTQKSIQLICIIIICLVWEIQLVHVFNSVVVFSRQNYKVVLTTFFYHRKLSIISMSERTSDFWCFIYLGTLKLLGKKHKKKKKLHFHLIYAEQIYFGWKSFVTLQ